MGAPATQRTSMAGVRFGIGINSYRKPMLNHIINVKRPEGLPNERKEPVEIVMKHGDIHGELRGFLENLLEARLINNQGEWIAGKSVLIQFGDVVDRGLHSVACFEFLADLQGKAREKGGDVVRLLGNHELGYLNGDLLDPSISKEDVEKLKRKIEEDVLARRIIAAYVDHSTGLPRLCVHGGFRSKIREIITKEVASEKGIDEYDVTVEMMAERMNDILVEAVAKDDYSHPIFGASKARGGTDPVGGIFWSDLDEVLGSNCALSIHQDVAHTPRPPRCRYYSVDRGNILALDPGLSKHYGSYHSFVTVERGVTYIYWLDNERNRWHKDMIELR